MYQYTLIVEESDDPLLSSSSQVVQDMQLVQEQVCGENKETFMKKESPAKLLKF